MEVFTSYTSMEASFASHKLDFIDTTLLPSDYTALSGDTKVTMGNVSVFSLREYDLNDAVAPFNSTAYRQGVTCLIDKNAFITDASLTGAAAPADSPIAAMGAWNNPNCAAENAFNYYTAFEDLQSSGYTLAPDAGSNTYCTWQFSSPFPTTGPSGEPAVPNSHISIYARTEAAERTYQGIYLQEQCGTAFPAAILALTGAEQSTVWGALPTTKTNNGNPQWPAASGNYILLPRIDVDVYDYPRATTSQYVMVDYDFMVYTGGWSLTSTPDFLQFYETEFTPAALGYAPYVHNYGSYADSTFDSDVNSLLGSVYPGNTSSPGLGDTNSGFYWAWLAQYRIMGQAGLIPMWYYTGASPVLTADSDAVNAVGVGFNNWWSFLDAYPTSSSPLYGQNALLYGWESGVQNMNPIESTWYWDWQILGEIYDSLVAGNPYDVSQINPYIATGWSYSKMPALTTLTGETGGTDLYTGTDMPVYGNLSVNLRSDVYWQDIPALDRSAFTYDRGSELNGPITNVKLTPIDVAFSIAYQEGMDYWYGTDNGYLIDDIGYVAVGTMYNNTAPGNLGAMYTWPYWNAAAYPNGPSWYNESALTTALVGSGISMNPWNYNFVKFDPSLNATTIRLYTTDKMQWLLYYRDLGAPVVPYHVFRYLATVGQFGGEMYSGKTVQAVETMDLRPRTISATGADLLYGTGPYIFIGETAQGYYSMIRYIAGASYEGIVEANHYFWYTGPPNPVTGSTTPGTATGTSSTTDAGLSLTFSQGLTNHNATAAATGTYSWDYEMYDPNGTAIGGVNTVAGGAFNIASGNTQTFTAPVTITHYADPLTIVWDFLYTITSGAPTVYLNILNTVSHTNVLPFNQGIVGLKNGWDLTFNQTLYNGLLTTPTISYYWTYSVYMFNATSDAYDILIATGNTLQVNGHGVPPGYSTVAEAVALNPALITTLDLMVTYSFLWTYNSQLYQIDYGAPTAVGIYPTSSSSFVFTPGDILQYFVPLTATLTNNLGDPAASISYGWTVTVNKFDFAKATYNSTTGLWTGPYDIPVTSNSTTGSVSVPIGATVPISTNVTLNLPTAPSFWGTWLNVTVTFYWKYGGNTYTSTGTTITAYAPGDINNDGVANGLDLSVMASNWLQNVPPANPAADINNDLVVNGLDLSILAGVWLQSYTFPQPIPGP